MVSINISSLSSSIREEALRLGFFKVGIAPTDPRPDGATFKKWLQAGMHGTMGYLQHQELKRLNPSLVLPNARSIVVLAMNYYPGRAPMNSPLRGRISRYAWGYDYHVVLRQRLERLLDFIKKQHPPVQGLCYVDTGPVMEKLWARRTSIGWMGKHTIMVTRERGSWFFLGVILLDLELEYDLQSKDFCGTCTRCLSSCPTGAIVAPYVVDARLCLSYLTVEYRGVIPRALRPLMGNRIFGCDDCQEACPWNRFAVRTTEEELLPEVQDAAFDLLQLGSMGPSEFEEKYRNRPIRRVTRDAWVRNVVIALGNSKSGEAVPVLGKALRDPSPLVRIHAAWALGNIFSSEALRKLKMAAGHETDPTVYEEINLALKRFECN